MPYSERIDDRGPARFVERDEIRAHLVDLTDVGQRAGVAGADPLQVVVEMRQVDQRQRRIELVFDDLRRLGNPPRRRDRGPRAPEVEQRKRAQPGLQFVAQGSRQAVDVGQLASVGRIHRPRRDADVRRRIHVEPPEQVRAREGRILRARDVPDFRREHQAVRLPPEAHLAVLAHVPAVADDAVSVGVDAGQVVGLRRAGDGGKCGFDRNRGRVASPSRDRWRAARDEVGGQADDIEDDGLLHRQGIRGDYRGGAKRCPREPASFSASYLVAWPLSPVCRSRLRLTASCHVLPAPTRTRGRSIRADRA